MDRRVAFLVLLFCVFFVMSCSFTRIYLLSVCLGSRDRSLHCYREHKRNTVIADESPRPANVVELSRVSCGLPPSLPFSSLSYPFLYPSLSFTRPLPPVLHLHIFPCPILSPKSSYGVWGSAVYIGRARPPNVFRCNGGQNWAYGAGLMALQNG